MKRQMSETTKDYLATNKQLGLGKGLTVTTWVRKYKGHTRWSWKCESEIYSNLSCFPNQSFDFVSAKGQTAYYPTSMMRGKNKEKLKLFLALKKMNPAISKYDLAKQIFGEK